MVYDCGKNMPKYEDQLKCRRNTSCTIIKWHKSNEVTNYEWYNLTNERTTPHTNLQVSKRGFILINFNHGKRVMEIEWSNEINVKLENKQRYFTFKITWSVFPVSIQTLSVDFFVLVCVFVWLFVCECGVWTHACIHSTKWIIPNLPVEAPKLPASAPLYASCHCCHFALKQTINHLCVCSYTQHTSWVTQYTSDVCRSPAMVCV